MVLTGPMLKLRGALLQEIWPVLVDSVPTSGNFATKSVTNGHQN